MQLGYSGPQIIRLTANHLNVILDQIHQNSRQEVCGFLAGIGVTVTAVYPVANIAENANHTFYMDPMEQLQALKRIDQRDLELLGIYHSHPLGARSDPSPTDIERATDPAICHVIIVPGEQGIATLRAFAIVDARVEELSIVLE